MNELKQYINPPEDVTKGRKLSYTTHDGLMQSLARGEHVYAYAKRALFYQARLVDDVREYNDVIEQYKDGIILAVDFYAVYVAPSDTVTGSNGSMLPKPVTGG